MRDEDIPTRAQIHFPVDPRKATGSSSAPYHQPGPDIPLAPLNSPEISPPVTATIQFPAAVEPLQDAFQQQSSEL